jgi:hypothetical protein
MRTEKVQTWLVNGITNRINETAGARITIGSIHFKFFNKLTINDLLIYDHNSDTLLYANEINAGLKSFNRSKKQITLARVSIMDPVIRIITDTSGSSNLSLFFDQIPRQQKDDDSLKTTISINHIDLAGGRVIIMSPDDPLKPHNGGVDFKNLSVTALNAIIEDFKVADGKTTMSVYRASFREQADFVVERFAASLTLSSGLLAFKDINLATPYTQLESSEISLSYDDSLGFKSFEDKVKMYISLDRSVIGWHDLSLFLPGVSIDPGKVVVSGDITGTLAQLRGRSVILEAGNITRLECDFDLSGLPDFENTYLYIDVNSLVTEISELSVLGLVKSEKLPRDLDREVGKMTFRGTFSGFPTDFVTYGRVITRTGTLSTDISLRPSAGNQFHYQGTLKGTGIDAGRIAGNTDLLGSADFHINIDGYIKSLKEFSAKLTGVIAKATINDYIYSNIELNGTFSEKTWDGSVNVNDANLELEFLGMIDFQNEMPEFDFSLNIPNARLFDLNLDKADTNSAVSLIVTANFIGNDIDNISGEIRLLNSTIRRNGKNLEIYDALLTTWSDNGKSAMDITTDFLSAKLRGDYNFSTLPYSFRTVLSNLLPSRFEKPDPVKDTKQNKFELKITLNDTEKLNNFFNTNLSIAPSSEINIRYLIDNDISTTFNSNAVSYSMFEFKNLGISAVAHKYTSAVNVRSSSFNFGGKADLTGFGIDMSTTSDTLNLNAYWDNKEAVLNKGSVGLMTVFSREGENKTMLVNVAPSSLFIQNKLWDIMPASVTIGKKFVGIEDIRIGNDLNYYHVSGNISEDSDDVLMLDFKGIDLGFFNDMYDKSSDGKLKLAIGGILSGEILVSGILTEIKVETDNVVVEKFRMIDHDYGNLYLKSQWENQRKIATISLFNDLNGTEALRVDGFFSPEERNLNLTAVVKSLPIDILNPVLSSFASGIKGYATGKVNLTGKINEPVLSGSVYVENGSMKVDYLQTQYFFNDSVRFNENGIVFRNISALDERGNSIRVNGTITHKHFNDFGIDLTFNANQAIVLNTKPKDNDMFYGTAVASGLITIRGSEGNMSFDIAAKTDRNTRFYVPMNSSQSVAEYSFITFTGGGDEETEMSGSEAEVKDKADGTMSLNIDLEVTPDAEVQLVLDSKAGDVMKARGAGKLNIGLNPKGDFSISGDYLISSGEYLFTLGNILNKKFNVLEGSRISWNGDIAEADIDIRAIYRLEASLYELVKIEELRDRIPVECHLRLTDRLTNPVISFDIVLPTADEQTRSYLRNAINTDDEMSRQFLYLLMVNRFYPDPAFQSGGSVPAASSTGTSALGSTTTEMFTNQVSNWLSQISNDFDVGFVYRPGNEISDKEVEVALSTQIINDRVKINGNFDVGGNQNTSSASSVTGVFDIEYTINEKLKLKFFNRSNDNILYETAPYTQGLGIFVRWDFDKLKDLFRRNPKPEAKKEEEPRIQGPDKD